MNRFRLLPSPLDTPTGTRASRGLGIVVLLGLVMLTLLGLFFTDEKNITSFSQVMNSNQKMFKQFFHAMLAEGVYLAPSAFEAGFISSAHNQNILDKTLAAADIAFASLKN